MGLFRKLVRGACLGLFILSSIAFGASNTNGLRSKNIETGFLSYQHLDTVQPYTVVSLPPKVVDIVDWETLNAIPNGSIQTCSPINKYSESWDFVQTHKRSETEIILVSRENESYPCQYVAMHLWKNQFNMASLEDIPLAISQKFFSKYPVFVREIKFYRTWFHKAATVDYIKHEEMHIIQALHNPHLERYMWNEDKSSLTEFGEFIEGCTEFHFKTDGPEYENYVSEYERLLTSALKNGTKIEIDRACGGDYDAFVRLGAGF